LKTNKRDTAIFIGLLSLFWLLIVFVEYGYTNKPFLPEELDGGLLVIWRTLTALLILSLAGGIGMSIGIQKRYPMALFPLV
jgi:hypothetical protein